MNTTLDMKCIGVFVFGFMILASVHVVGCYTIANETEIEDLKQVVLELFDTVTKLNDTLQKEKQKPVMFNAVIRGKSYKYNVDANVVFETVLVNKGGYYNKNDGVFVAPIAGTYLFAWTVSAYAGYYMFSELVIEDNVIVSTGEQDASGGYYSGSMTAFSKMEAGEHAWIRSTGYTSAHRLYSHDNFPESAFLGWLIHSH